MTKDPNRVASGKKSKNKGATFERKVAKILQEYWSQVSPGCSFRRTPGSGGWARSGGNLDKFGSAGDCVCDDTTFPWCLEMKHYASYDVEKLLNGKNATIMQWWDQADGETPEGKSPLLIMKRNGSEELVMFDYGRFPSCTSTVAELIKGMNQLRFERPNRTSLVMVTLKDFLSIDPKEYDRD